MAEPVVPRRVLTREEREDLLRLVMFLAQKKYSAGLNAAAERPDATHVAHLKRVEREADDAFQALISRIFAHGPVGA